MICDSIIVMRSRSVKADMYASRVNKSVTSAESDEQTNVHRCLGFVGLLWSGVREFS